MGSPQPTDRSGARTRKLAGFVLTVAVSLALGLVLLEVVLWLVPGVVGGRLANAVRSIYRENAGGIYFRDRPSGMLFMKPDFAAQGYWNGHVWQHRTDAHGFRNPPDTARDGLLLFGDSMIYGHGVEEEDTVAHFLRSEHGRSAYNMGRQGDTLFQEYVLARLALQQLHPEELVVFVFLNDFQDMTIHRSTEQIADPPELGELDFAALAARLREAPGESLRKSYRRLRVWRLYDGLREAATATPPDPDAENPLFAAILDEERSAPVAEYYRRVLGDLAARARARGVGLTVVLLDIGEEVIPGALPAQDRLYTLLTEIGRENHFPVLTTRPVFLRCPECFLPDDGHLTREGHRRLAEFVDREVPRATPHP